jgi:hypothetical protein
VGLAFECSSCDVSIQGRVPDHIYISALGRGQWSRPLLVQFLFHQALPSEEGRVQWNRKPDLVLLECVGDCRDSITWKNLQAIGELTSSDLKQNKTLISSLNTKAYILLCSQPWRRYVLAFSLADDELQIHLFDRSGVVVSPPIKLHANVSETCQIVYTFARANPVVLGFDPMVRIFDSHILRPPSSSSVGTIDIERHTYDIISILWTSNGFIGRCTNTFHVRIQHAPPPLIYGEVDEYDYVVKDGWLEVDLINHEQSILDHIAGTEGVPKLLKAWTVKNEGRDDSTDLNRPNVWDPSLAPRYVTRIHRRLLMAPLGSPLSSFKSQKELLLGLIEGLESTSIID